MNLQAIAQSRTSYPLGTVAQNKDLVTSIQNALNVMGFNAGSLDGRWTATTEAAYKKFAKQYGFKTDELTPRVAKFILSSAGLKPAPVPVVPRPSPTPAPRPNPSVIVTPPIVTPPSPSGKQNAVLEEALKFTLQWEGGYVDHPSDPGGATNKGVTTATYNEYLWSKGRPKQHVRNITDAEVEEIYRDLYWKPSQAETMTRSLAIVHFDTAVNFGVGGAVMFLQEVLGLGADGVYGAKTKAALDKANTYATAKRYCDARINYRYDRVAENRSQEAFLQGWLNRDNDLLKYIASMR
jgi:peptidoglycan hydrolase-like protein with peptidoglycan-binding domain